MSGISRSPELGPAQGAVRYSGADFNGIFAGLGHNYDCVLSGTTITPERKKIADFCAPSATSGQSLAVDPSLHPSVRGVADIERLQEGNTRQPVADRLVAEHNAAGVRVYAYDDIEKALGGLSTGGCDVFMKLAPVTEWFARDRPQPKVVQTGITRERLGVCVRRGDAALKDAIDQAQAELVREDVVAKLIQQWPGTGATGPS